MAFSTLRRALMMPCLAALLALPVRADGPVAVRAIGEMKQQDGAWQSSSKASTLVIGEPNLAQARVRLQMLLTKGPTTISLLPETPEDTRGKAAMRVSVTRDGGGRELTFRPVQLDPTTGKPVTKDKAEKPVTLKFMPGEKEFRDVPAAAPGILQPKSWQGRWLNVRVDAEPGTLSLWIEGRMIQQLPRPVEARGGLAITLGPGEQVRNITLEPLIAGDRFLPVDLDAYVNETLQKPFGAGVLQHNRVPFILADRGRGVLNMRHAGWIDWKRDQRNYREDYDGGAPYLDDMRMPMLRVPGADYIAAHVLAIADGDTGSTPVLTLRAGRYGWNDQTIQHDFTTLVPRASADDDTKFVNKFHHVSVPMMEAFAQDIEKYFDIELTKELRLARRQDDAVRYRIRPLGPPSGVRIAAITFERSPLQMKVSSSQAGHAFEQPNVPTFDVQLTNITAQAQNYRLMATATHFYGAKTQTKRLGGNVGAGETVTVQLPVPVTLRGYYDVALDLNDGVGRPLLQRRTSFALLPPNERKYRAQSPFGTWDFYGGHFTPNDPDMLGPLYIKLGMRFGMFNATTEALQKYGVIYGSEPKTYGDKAVEAYEQFLKRLPGYTPPGLIFHENSISLPHIVRVPDLFTDRAPYKLNEAEEKQFKTLWDAAIIGATAMRAKYPQAHLRFGNGSLPLKEEFYRHKFPTELFDSAGNEAPSASRLPEAQPPDTVVNNSSLWMERQLLDAYGYPDKPVTQCYEIGYVNSNPGNLTTRTQADYFVRHALHSMAWGIPEIRLGTITDIGNSYYFSNWGASGFCTAAPEMSVKPSFVAFATMTRVLDGAKFSRDVATGSPSVYVLEFARPDGSTAFAIWTVRGRRPVTFSVDAGAWTLVDDQANESAPLVNNGRVVVTAAPSPVYLIGKGRIGDISLGAPLYYDQPQGKVTKLSSLANMDDWQVETGRNAELENFNPLSPRRLGNFAFEPVRSFEGQSGVLRVTPGPITHGKATMPMYAVLSHRTGIAIPGKPTEIGLWVNGNSAWGRIIYEFKDASGQRWISIGRESKDMAERYKVPGVSGFSNDDGFNVSRINFDGWRYLGSPLPGNYPGEGFGWPANSQWRSSVENTVHYPLILTKLIVELPEKTLHVKTYSSAPRPEIYLKDLMVCEGAVRGSE